MEDFIQDEKEVLREFNDLNILFKIDGTYEIMLDTDLKFNKCTYVSSYDDNIDVLI